MKPNPLLDYRESIDLLDESLVNLLAERMRVVRKIIAYKKEAGIEFYLPDRWEGIVANRVNQGKKVGLDAAFIQDIYAAIHDGGMRLNAPA